ncbi:pyridoxal phosphate-dependent aminotransferase [Bradyrhizobium sp. RDM12]
MLAERTALFKSSENATGWSAAEAAAASGDQIIDLSAGEIFSDGAPPFREGAILAINRNLYRSNEPYGLMQLRHALARKISSETAQCWSADEVAIASGAKQALFNVAMAILDPGDEVLIPTPYWSTFPIQIGIAGGSAVFIETRHSKYVPRLADLAAAVTSKTKAVVVNTPASPTGAVYDRSTLAGIAQLAIDRDLWVIFDECYGAFAHAPHVHYPILSVAPRARDRTLIINSFSKSLALTGWDIGYLAGPKNIIGAIDALQRDAVCCPDVIAQHALLHQLESGDTAFELKLQLDLASARALGLQILSALKFVPQPAAQGGFHFYLDFSQWQRQAYARGCEFDADDVVRVLLFDAGVAAASGAPFGDPAGVRLSYGVDLVLLDKALRRATTTLNTWK